MPKPFANNSNLLIAAAAGVSLLVHGVLAWQVHDRPMGKVSLEELTQVSRPPMRIRQEPLDISEYQRELTPPLTDDATILPMDELNENAEDVKAPELPEFVSSPEIELLQYDEQLLQPTLETDSVEQDWSSQELVSAVDSVDVAPIALQENPDAQNLPDNDSGMGLMTAAGGHSQTANQLLRQGGPNLSAGANPLTPPPPAPSLPTMDLAAPTTAAIVLPELTRPGSAMNEESQTQWIIPTHLDHAFDYYVSRYRASTGQSNGYFRVRIEPKPRDLQVLTIIPKDVVYLLDISSSIPDGRGQSVVNQMIEGVQQALAQLRPGDRFNVVLFNDTVNAFNTLGLSEATEANIQQAQAYLDQIQSGGDQTDVYAAIEDYLQPADRSGRVYNLIVVTDGHPNTGIRNTEELINRITADNQRNASIYCVGVPSRLGDPNGELLDFLSYRNGGRSVLVDQANQVSAAIQTLSTELRDPLIRDVTLTVIGADVHDVHPIYIADIHQNQPFEIYGRYISEGPFTLRIAGNGIQEGQMRPVDFTFRRDLNYAQQSSRELARRWSFWKLHHLYSERIRQGSSPTLEANIRQLREGNP